MKNKKEISKEEIENRKRKLKVLKIIMIVLDVFALILLGYQIYIKEVIYSSYVVLIFCNIITFISKVDDK